MRLPLCLLVVCGVTVAIPAAARAQNFSNCSLNMRDYVRSSYDLVNHAGDIMQYNEKITRREDYSENYPRLGIDNKYGFRSYPVAMSRTGSLWTLGIGCDLGTDTRFEFSFSRGSSQGQVSGIINSSPDTIRWRRPTWQSQPLPVLNFEVCLNEFGEWNGLPCVTPIPYWSKDQYSSNTVDALVAYTLLRRKGFTLDALAGVTLSRMRYTFIDGERQFARIKQYFIIGSGKTYIAEYMFNNDIFLETTSTSNATFVGPSFGMRASKSMGRIRFDAMLRNDILRGFGSDSVAFIDVDDMHDCLRNLETGTVYWCTDIKLDGRANFTNSRRDFSSKTLGEVGASVRLHKRADLNVGFSVSHSTGYLTQQLTKQWGLSSNKAPDAMELSSLPRKGGDSSGFGFSGMYLGFTVKPF